MSDKLFRIKPLVWKQEHQECWCAVRGHYDKIIHRAKAKGMTYFVYDCYGPIVSSWYGFDDSYCLEAESIEAAKVAAEEHYRKQVEKYLVRVKK